MKRYFLTIIIILLGIMPTTSFAYSETTDGGEMIAVVNPKSPGSFSDVEISIKSFGVDLDRSQIIWLIDGKETKKGLGAKNIGLKTGAVGKIVTVTVSATDPNEQTVTKTIEINPADVDLLWESNSHVPVFYKGAALPSVGSRLRIHAVPNFKNNAGSRINPANLVYKWRVNYQSANSGDQKSALDLIMGDTTQSKITVDVSDASDETMATKTLTLTRATPKSIFYEVDSLLGPIYNVAVLGTFNMVNKESVIKAEPFYMTNQQEKAYDWTVNSAPFVPEGGDIGTITLRQGAGKGESALGVTIRNQSGQSAFGSLLIKFGQNIFNF
ncbi:MAG: hypothetical protein HZA94_02765 [Candidatus Vogelbacteria bacterium]|nr:hypothetical protein [Candidatus Vogelbacteria bacterium]